MTGRDASVAARVPTDLREELEAIAARENVELSIVVRRALRRYADEEAGRVPRRPSLLDGGTGARRRNATATEAAAALKTAPRVGTARFRALADFELAGHRGRTADEVCHALEPAPVNGTARRVTDLLQGGLIRPLEDFPDGVPIEGGRRGAELVTRPTRNGALAQVYVITPAGHRALEDARARARAKEAQAA